jgi:hypothetical protein
MTVYCNINVKFIYIIADMINMELNRKHIKCHRNRLSKLVILSSLILALLSGCASTKPAHTNYAPQVITVKEKLTVHLYSSLDDMRTAYMYAGGDPRKMKRVKGFYSDRKNSLHCLKWDYYTCGHELFHALQYKGNDKLVAEKGYEHFKERNYTSE